MQRDRRRFKDYSTTFFGGSLCVLRGAVVGLWMSFIPPICVGYGFWNKRSPFGPSITPPGNKRSTFGPSITPPQTGPGQLSAVLILFYSAPGPYELVGSAGCWFREFLPVQEETGGP